MVWSDVNDGSIQRVEVENLHNTKITSNAIHDKMSRESSRKRPLPFGRIIGSPQMLHNLLGYSEVTMKNMHCIEICTLPFEFRGRAKVRLDRNGNISKKKGKSNEEGSIPDGVSIVTKSFSLRSVIFADHPRRRFSDDQKLLLTCTEQKHLLTDPVSLFGVRPPELMPLVRKLGMYHEMFDADDGILSNEEIESSLCEDVDKCLWIDGVGRRIRLRHSCVPAFTDHLRALPLDGLPQFAVAFRETFLSAVDNDTHDVLSRFIFDDGLIVPPVVVYSRITPEQHTKFALHLLLVLGEFDTELDFKTSGSFKDSFVKAGLFDNVDVGDKEAGNHALNKLLKRIILEVVPVQPISTKKLDTFIVRSHRVLKSLLLEDCAPMLNLPPCLQTQLYADKHSEMMDCWDSHRRLQLESMMGPLENLRSIPSREDIFHATKEDPATWDPLTAIPKLSVQSPDSFQEQQFAIGIGKRAVDNYLRTFGSKQVTKGVLFNGAPGAGKTYILQTVGLYAMSMGLRVMSTALMAARARTLGGLNIHQLFRWDQRRNGNLFRLAQVCAI